MNKLTETQLAEKLQNLFTESEIARDLFEAFSRRIKDSKQTTVERAANIVSCEYVEMRDIMMRLGDMGVGEYIMGRKGHPSRIAWNYSIRSLGEVAAGTSDNPAGIGHDADVEDGTSDETGKLISHAFQLREDCQIELNLPADLTTREAERLALFIKTVPY